MHWTPLIALHTSFALGALALGPVALWARLGRMQRPRWHRAAGYAWVVCMVGAAFSALFIRATVLPLFAGLGVIHLLVLLTFGQLWLAFAALRRGRIAAHRQAMQGLYIGACLVAGAFTLLPGRLLGQLLWGQWLGLL